MHAPAFNFRNLLFVAALSAAAISFANAALQSQDRQLDAVGQLAKIKPGFGPTSYGVALKATAVPISLANERVARRPGDWLNQESYAYAFMTRFRLTGDYDDLAAAKGALDYAAKSTPPGTGPIVTDAVFASTSHNLDRLEKRLGDIAQKVITPQADELSEAAALAGDLHFYSGRYDAALADYRRAAAIADGPGVAFRLGRYHQRTGNPDAAIRHFASAASKTRQKSPQFLSSVWLQIGTVELERGNWDKAERYFAKADALFPGHWLNEAHLAQMLAVRGDIVKAKAAYQNIANRSGSPEVMDALAGLYLADGNAAQSQYWSAKSAAIWDARLKLLPQAAFGHAVDHQMFYGSPPTALELARKNHAARPYGDSAILLGWAYLENGMPAEARTLLDALSKTKWQSAQQYAALTKAYAMLGQEKASASARERALALNPKIFEPSASLMWFGHH